MIIRTFAVLMLAVLVSNACLAQNEIEKENRILSLKNGIVNQQSETNKLRIENTSAKSGKSPGLALLFSLILPGAGHYYIDRMDVGKYFLGVDAASWIGLASLNVYGDNVRDDSRTFSAEHADVKNIDGKPDDYWGNIGNFSNIYEYNNDKLIRGEYALVYDVNQFYWNWDNENNKNIYETQRKNSERIYNTRIVFGSILVANRIISGISAYLLAGKKDEKKSSLIIQPELLRKYDYSFDGVRINLSKNF